MDRILTDGNNASKTMKKKGIRQLKEETEPALIKKSKPSVISMFSGCGGMDLGFKDAGFEILWANDNNKYACETYRKNIGNEILCEDIRSINLEDVPQAEVLIAGFPCQPFSSAGLRNGIKDPRGNLYLECFKVVNDKRPEFALFENVRGIMSIHKGRTLREIIKAFNILGYKANYQLLNASDHGVPQNRYRLMVAAWRKDGLFEFPKKIASNSLTITHALKDIPKDAPNQEALKLPPQIDALMDYIPEGGSWKDIPYEKLPERLKKIRDNMKLYHSPNFMRRFSRDEIMGTVTASATPENMGVLHPVERRRFNLRELARIQSFPDYFTFYGPLREQYKQVGNAVPPKLAFEVSKQIKQFIEEKNAKKALISQWTS
jgi:DNA (cytosine-5)-methyltransferase 1